MRLRAIDTNSAHSLLLHLLDIEMMPAQAAPAGGQKNATAAKSISICLLVGDLINPQHAAHAAAPAPARACVRAAATAGPNAVAPARPCKAADLLARITDQRIEPAETPPAKSQ